MRVGGRRIISPSASHVWQQDHNGFTHQDPGFLDHVVNKKADVVRVYLPAGRQPLLQRNTSNRDARRGQYTSPAHK